VIFGILDGNDGLDWPWMMMTYDILDCQMVGTTVIKDIWNSGLPDDKTS
jgi:hypothetical protein